MKKNILIGVLCMLIACICLPASSFASGVEFSLDPDLIKIEATYDGTTVVVKGIVPKNSEALILLSGKRTDVHLKRKGKALGLLWMNMGEVLFRNSPTVYLLYSAKSISDLSKNQQGEKTDLGYGFESLQRQIQIESKTGGARDKEMLFKEFLKLKNGEGLYAELQNSVHYVDNSDSSRSFEANIQISPRLRAGDYIVTTFAVNDGSVTESQSRTLKIKEVGFPALVSFLAYEHSALYGIISVLIAIAAGLLIGLIFNRKKKNA
ncbi:MAG: TIGR02186 family protein [SAR324 cluster bacterium]|nr:TIGR02186 family protein [SAR324 cluster bacterium]